MGYYESWSPQRPCDSFTPSQLAPEKYTHLYYSFALIGGDGSVSLAPRLVTVIADCFLLTTLQRS